MKLIAYYLPQFHPIPENDAWWGKGFTEWTNVTKARPLFPGHYQPHLPTDLGFYDLRVPEVREEQANLARQYGIHGFCYYYYWFGGKRLLEKPMEAMLASGEPDFPFCVCWANENWSRRWDGSEHDILVKQEYAPADMVAFAKDLVPILCDRRYIRIDGRPLVLIYRAGVIPRVRIAVNEWRKVWREAGIGEVHLSAAMTFGDKDPIRLGFDSGVEFPPHGNRVPDSKERQGISNFDGGIYDYSEVVLSYLLRGMPNYKLFRAVFPSWDNTPRKGCAGHVFMNASPEVYAFWLRCAIEQTRRSHEESEHFVFINAWNEWAEGAHLEPDQKFGRQYLKATKQALEGIDSPHTTLHMLEHLLDDHLPEYSFLARDLREHFSARERTIAALSRLNEEVTRPDDLFIAVDMAEGLPHQISGNNLNGSMRFYVDRLNETQLPSNRSVTVSKRYSLYANGWAFHPQVRDPSAYFVLESADQKTRYHAPILSRHRREDLVDHFSDVPADITEQSGFEGRFTISEVPSGRYRVGIMICGDEGYSLAFLHDQQIGLF